MHALVVGGTGFLGSAIADRLGAAGHTVVVTARTPPVAPLPAGVTYRHFDANTAGDAAYADVAAGTDLVVHCLGPDDRSALADPVDDYLARELVDRTVRVAGAARAAGATRMVVLGSYFTAWERTHPGYAAPHPYIRARLAQHAATVAAGGEELSVCTVEIPYVFGEQPGRISQWKPLYDVLRRLPVVACPDGGTTGVTRDTIADAVAAALDHGTPGASYPVGDDDITWEHWARLGLDELGLRRPFAALPRAFTAAAGLALAGVMRLARKPSGLNPTRLADDIVHNRLFVDHAATRAALGIGRRDLEADIRASVRASYPGRAR